MEHSQDDPQRAGESILLKAEPSFRTKKFTRAFPAQARFTAAAGFMAGFIIRKVPVSTAPRNHLNLTRQHLTCQHLKLDLTLRNLGTILAGDFFGTILAIANPMPTTLARLLHTDPVK